MKGGLKYGQVFGAQFARLFPRLSASLNSANCCHTEMIPYRMIIHEIGISSLKYWFGFMTIRGRLSSPWTRAIPLIGGDVLSQAIECQGAPLGNESLLTTLSDDYLRSLVCVSLREEGLICPSLIQKWNFPMEQCSSTRPSPSLILFPSEDPHYALFCFRCDARIWFRFIPKFSRSFHIELFIAAPAYFSWTHRPLPGIIVVWFMLAMGFCSVTFFDFSRSFCGG